MNKMATNLIIGGLIGAGSIAIMNMDQRDVRRVQRRGKQLMNRAEDLVDDLRSYM